MRAVIAGPLVEADAGHTTAYIGPELDAPRGGASLASRDGWQVELLHIEVPVGGGGLPLRFRVAVLETPLSEAVTVAL